MRLEEFESVVVGEREEREEGGREEFGEGGSVRSKAGEGEWNEESILLIWFWIDDGDGEGNVNWLEVWGEDKREIDAHFMDEASVTPYDNKGIK